MATSQLTNHSYLSSTSKPVINSHLARGIKRVIPRKCQPHTEETPALAPPMRPTTLSRRRIKGGPPQFKQTVNWSVVYRCQGDDYIIAPGYEEAARNNLCFHVTWENDRAVAENDFHEYGICMKLLAKAEPGDLTVVTILNGAWRLANMHADGSLRDAVTNRLYRSASVLGVVVSESEGMSREQLDTHKRKAS